MNRTIPAIATLSGRRSLTTTPQQGTPPAAGSTSTAPPTPPPAPRPGFIRRSLPVAFVGSIAYTAYKSSTDKGAFFF